MRAKVRESGVEIASFCLRDVTDRYVSWLNDPQVMRFTQVSGKRHTPKSTRSYVQDAIGDKGCRFFRILSGGAHIGNIRLSAIDRKNARCEIAILIGDKMQWGKGIAPVAIELASRHAFKKLGMRKISAIILEPNRASLRTFKKAGFAAEGILRSHYRYGRGYVDAVVMTRFADSAGRV